MLQENLFQLSGQKKWQTYAIISLMQFGRPDEIIVTEIKSIEFTILGLDLNRFQHVLSDKFSFWYLNCLNAISYSLYDIAYIDVGDRFEMSVTDL